MVVPDQFVVRPVALGVGEVGLVEGLVGPRERRDLPAGVVDVVVTLDVVARVFEQAGECVSDDRVAGAADVNRLSNCRLPVATTDGDLVRFCGYNMTTDDGEYALRNRNGWGGRAVVDDTRAGADADADADADGTAGYDRSGATGDSPGVETAETTGDGTVTDGGCGPDCCGGDR